MTASGTLTASLWLALYYAVLGSLAFFGLHRLVLLWSWFRHREEPRQPEHDSWPVVTVQLPVYNEMYVAGRLIDAVCALDYPRHLLEIQVLDDSTDGTRRVAAERVAHYRGLGFSIELLHRTDRHGFKAGALEAGLQSARGELLAVFDADFVPHADFLRRTVPYFADPKLGVVQARWDHINRDYSLLTRVQAILLDGHFLIEHTARNRAGRFFNFNGTAGIWRRQAIVDAGGWEHDTLTEDLDLSYRAQLAGWRFLFLPKVPVPAELPVDVHALKRQQYRWAKGSIQTARKLLPSILRSPFPMATKLEAFVHLTNNFAYLLMVLLSLLVFPAMMLRRHTDPRVMLTVDLPLFFGATLAVLAFYVVSQLQAHGDWERALKELPYAFGLGIGLSVNNARAVMDGLVSDGGTFERTPKYRIEHASDSWKAKRYKVPIDSTLFVEGLLAGYFWLCATIGWMLEMWWSLPFLILFLMGYSYIFVLSAFGRGLKPWRPARGQAVENGT